jgi:hypothetical protein
VSASARLLAGDFCGLPLTACRTGFCYEDFCRRSCARNRDCGSNGVCEFVEAPQVLGRPPSQVSVCESRANVDAEGIEQLCCTDADCSTNQLCAPNMIDRETWHMSCRGKE